MSRPELGQLAPTSGITATTRVGNINNPQLDPIRATTYDAGLEWYFRRGSLLSVAYFRKDIKSYIQRVTSQIPFNQLGLPEALLAGSNTAPTEIFTIGQPVNTPGGPLEGVEVNAQIQLDFLPGFLGNFGVLGNYTRVTSTIQYILASVNGVPTVTTTADLVGLSKNTASGTIFYEDDRFSIRSTASYRDRYIRGIPASPGSDLQGNSPNLFVDASASFNLNDSIKLIVEAQNLTDERNNLYIDSVRQDTLFQTRIGRTFTAGVNFQF
jgi:TonB-dependent receptor